jgi:hypothetical protein
MDEATFWTIVDEIKWPKKGYDEAKLWFMQHYSVEEAKAFTEIFLKKKSELARASEEDRCCDSWDDTLAHIIGLGEEEYTRNIKQPDLIVKRERDMDYKESFAYCIPFSDDYKKLTDNGYDTYINWTKELITELESADEDDIPPKLYRQFPKIIEVLHLLVDKNWPEAVKRYHAYFGPGYADDWPLDSFGIPNFVSDLERYRLMADSVRL